MHLNDHDVTGAVRTTDPVAVGGEVCRIYRELYPRTSAGPLERAFVDASRIYYGGHPDYLPCDTEYHDIQHVLDVTLAMARLMHGYERGRNGEEAIEREMFIVGALAALFHDFGYLRKRHDRRHSFGAEYTLVHVSRGAAFLRRYVRDLGLGEKLARLAATLVHFTGYERPAESIRIAPGLPRRIGQMLGSADIIAQMSDRCYLEKCRDRLYPEFVLGTLGAPAIALRKLPVFESGQDLVNKTPGFYQGARRRLDLQLARAYEYAGRHFGGANLYLQGMEKNIQYAANAARVLRRQPPHTLLPEVQPYPRDLVGLAG